MRKTKKRLTRREYRVLKNLINDASKPVQESNYSFTGSGSIGTLVSSIQNSNRKRNSNGESITFNQCTKMLPTNLYVSQLNTNTIHVLTYLSLTNVECTFVQAEGHNQQVAFFEEEELNKFYAWYGEYKKKFPEDQLSRDYPPPTDRHYPIMIPRYDPNGAHSMVGASEDVHTRWIWCLENLESEVRYLGENFFFCDPEDAMLYKLKFTSV